MRTKFTLNIVSGWALLFGLLRIGVLVFIGLNSPWYITTLAAALSVRVEGRKPAPDRFIPNQAGL